MKRTKFLFIVLLGLSLLFAGCNMANDNENAENPSTQGVWDASDDLAFTLMNNEVKIIGYTGSHTDIAIPDNIGIYPVVSVEDKVFEYRTDLRSVILPDSLTTIGYAAFRGCTGLSSITLPDSLDRLEDCAFDCCTGLTSVTLPDNLSSLGLYVFRDCTGLSHVYCKNPSPPNLYNPVFENNASDRKFYIDSSFFQSYWDSSDWRDYQGDLISTP